MLLNVEVFVFRPVSISFEIRSFACAMGGSALIRCLVDLMLSNLLPLSLRFSQVISLIFHNPEMWVGESLAVPEWM